MTLPSKPLTISIEKKILPKSEVELLKDIQGNILKKNGGGVEALLFLNFGNDLSKGEVNNLKSKIRSYAKQLTNAYMQLHNAFDKKEGGSLNTFIGFYLTYQGYKALEIPDSETPTDPSFRLGMKDAHLKDPSPDNWDRMFDTDVHGMFLIIDDNRIDVESKIEELEDDWEKEIIGTQFGKKLTSRNGATIEHFGYVDGISQPLFFKQEIEKEKDKNQSGKKWDPSAALSLALVKEPTDKKKSKSNPGYGSYLVYRKLEQNVKAFKTAEEQLAHQLGFSDETEEVAGALMIGRFENGLPVVKFGSTEDPEEPSMDNDFLYDIDREGSRCPFHSHIRKTNPRGDSEHFFGIDLETERDHRIARRGITYDDIGRGDDLSFHPERGVGLLFMCFQSSIVNQFEFMQKNWANNNDFPKPFSGVDPVVGQGENRTSSAGVPAEQKWTDVFGQQQCLSLSEFVNMKGGEYFFTPSIKFLERL